MRRYLDIPAVPSPPLFCARPSTASQRTCVAQGQHQRGASVNRDLRMPPQIRACHLPHSPKLPPSYATAAETELLLTDTDKRNPNKLAAPPFHKRGIQKLVRPGLPDTISQRASREVGTRSASYSAHDTRKEARNGLKRPPHQDVSKTASDADHNQLTRCPTPR